MAGEGYSRSPAAPPILAKLVDQSPTRSQNRTSTKPHPQKPAKSTPPNCYSGNRVIQTAPPKSRPAHQPAANSFCWTTLAATNLSSVSYQSELLFAAGTVQSCAYKPFRKRILAVTPKPGRL